MKSNSLKLLISHPDHSEIVSKLVMDISPNDIHEWLKAKYKGQKELILSRKILIDFKNEHLDAYTILREDAKKLYSNQLAPQDDLQLTLQGNSDYQNRLSEFLDKEIDIQTILRKMIFRVETRAEQIFDQISMDDRNIKMDRTLIEWLNLLLSVTEKYQPILQGTSNTINIQNNYNIQMVDKKINVVYDAIREALSDLDYETSLAFIEKITTKLAALEENATETIPIEHRLIEAQEISADLREKLQE
jgi:hypothetical protein